MDISKFLPPSDLLHRTRGVEAGLKQRRRLGAAGFYGFLLLSSLQIGLALAESAGKLAKPIAEHALLLALFVPSAFLLLLYVWSRYWLQASRQPFRYTCSIGAFTAVDERKESRTSADSCMTWMPHDLGRLLNERVNRFLFASAPADAKAADGGKDETEPAGESVHIHGHYVVRRSAEGTGFEIEVMPQVRVGAGRPEVRAVSIVYVLEPTDATPVLDRAHYEELLEQVYHAVVTELYRQLKDDVQRKIALLPALHYRAMALLHEADDYARSNTLHAYEEAQALYGQAAQLVAPDWRTPPEGRLLRLAWRVQCRVHRARAALRRLESHYRAQAQAVDVLFARALTGYARMQLFRWPLTTLVNGAATPIFEARPVARRARDVLEALGPDVAGRDAALFDARAVLALACQSLGDEVVARTLLDQARAADPQRAERDVTFLYARSQAASNAGMQLSLLRRAVELSPRFEVAQFQLAIGLETQWRRRGELDEASAGVVLEEYRKLQRVNPSNLGAWANAGFVYWLLGSDAALDKALACYRQGARVKRVRPEIFVGELDYGLARVYAERGSDDDLLKAYACHAAALSGILSREADLAGFRDYFFDPASPAALQRMQRYRARALSSLRRARAAQRRRAPHESGQRHVQQALRAFILNDLGEAYTRDEDAARAERYFKRALHADAAYVLPYYNLGLLFPWSPDEPKRRYLERVVSLHPQWPPGKLALARQLIAQARELLTQSDAPLNERIAQLSAKLTDAGNANRKQDTALRVLDLGAAGTPAAATAVDKDAIEAELSELRQQQRDSSRKTAERRRDAAAALERARELAGSLLPHQWLWDGDALSLRSLDDRVLKARLRWEREFNDLHARAFYEWTLSCVHDPSERARALRLLDHLLEHFWPADTGVLRDWIVLNRDQAGSDPAAVRELVRTTCARAPRLVGELALDDYGFDVSEQIELQKAAVEFDPDEERSAPFRRSLAALYAGMAHSDTDPAAAVSWARLAAQAGPDDAWQQLALARALERRAGRDDHDALQEASDAARRALEVDPPAEEAAEVAERLRGKLEAYERRSQRLRDLRYRFDIDEPGRWRAFDDPFVVDHADDLRALFKPAPDSDEAHQRDSALDLLAQALHYELGMHFPAPEFGRADLEPSHCAVRLWGVERATFELRADRWLIADTPDALAQYGIRATPAQHPVSGRACAWVAASEVAGADDRLRRHGIRSWRPIEVAVLHLAALLRRHAHELLRVDDVTRLLEEQYLHETLARLRAEGTLVAFTRSLRALVREQFCLRELHGVAKAFFELGGAAARPAALAEALRRHPNVRRQAPYFRAQPSPALLRVGRRIEAIVDEGLRNGRGVVLALEPSVLHALQETVRAEALHAQPPDRPLFLLASARSRAWLRQLLEPELPHLHVVSEQEVFPEAVRQVIGTLDARQEIAA